MNATSAHKTVLANAMEEAGKKALEQKEGATNAAPLVVVPENAPEVPEKVVKPKTTRSSKIEEDLAEARLETAKLEARHLAAVAQKAEAEATIAKATAAKMTAEAELLQAQAANAKAQAALPATPVTTFTPGNSEPVTTPAPIAKVEPAPATVVEKEKPGMFKRLKFWAADTACEHPYVAGTVVLGGVFVAGAMVGSAMAGGDMAPGEIQPME